ncbi:MAG: rane protein insertase YidC, partial [Bacteroidota bacterium]
MKTDKNTVIGFVLLAGLFFVYFWYTSKQQNEIAAYKKRFDDSVAVVKATAEKAAALKTAQFVDSTRQDTTTNAVVVDTLKEQIAILENDLIKVELTNKGGQVASVTLKGYTNSKKELVQLGDSSSLTYAVNTGNNQTVQINQVIFPVANVSTDQNGVQKIEYVWTAPNGKTIKH